MRQIAENEKYQFRMARGVAMPLSAAARTLARNRLLHVGYAANLEGRARRIVDHPR